MGHTGNLPLTTALAVPSGDGGERPGFLEDFQDTRTAVEAPYRSWLQSTTVDTSMKAYGAF
jgi:hypothetical protein